MQLRNTSVDSKIRNQYVSQATSIESVPMQERLFLVSVVLMGFGQYLLPGTDRNEGSGSPLANVFWLAAYFYAFIGLNKQRARVREIVRASLPLVLVLIVVSASTLWSPEPMLTARRSLELVGTTGLALYFVCRLRLSEFVRTLSIGLAVSGVVSLLLVVFYPSFGTSEGYQGAWNGLFNHKNALGPAMVLGLVTSGCLIDRSRGVERALQITALTIFTILLIGAQSAGSTTSALMIGALVPFFLWSRATQRGRLVLLVALVLAVTLVGTMIVSSFGIDEALGTLGKESTLTGRTELWQLVISAISAKPFLGYGFGTFWGDNGPAASLVYPGIANHWEPNSAHNGFLEVALTTGLFGLGLLVLMLVQALIRTSRMFWRGADGVSIWPLLTMLAVIDFNLSEATFEAYNSVDWILLASAFFVATDAQLTAKKDSQGSELQWNSPKLSARMPRPTS